LGIFRRFGNAVGRDESTTKMGTYFCASPEWKRRMNSTKDNSGRPRVLTDRLRPVSHTKLHEQIVAQIQELIHSGNLQHGDRLPPERELAAIFGVSRHSVREAMRRLEQQGMLKSRVGSGTFVILDESCPLSEFLSVAIHREKSKISDIFQFRRMIEPQIARLAAQNADSADIVRLERIVRDQMQSLDDPVLAGEHDQAFHIALARATGNSVLFHIVERIADVLRYIRDEVSQTAQRQHLSLKGHQTLLAAIREGDPEAAQTAMEKHLATIEQTVLNHGGT
jgi:GntR family transcriptional repressor for pyruvate dehydrogenase complex